MGRAVNSNRLSIVFSIMLFFIVFNPPLIGGFSFTLLFLILSFLYCVKNVNILFSILRVKKIKSILNLIIIFFLYIFLTGFINYAEYNNTEIFSNIIDALVGYDSLLSISFAIVIFSIKKKLDFDHLLRGYVFAGVYQSILGIACLLIPPVKTFFNSLVEMNSRSEKISRTIEFVSAYRNYGFASTLFDIFGMAMSVLAILAIFQGIKGKKSYYIAAAMITLCAVINSRTSFVLILVGLLVFVFSTRGKVTMGWVLKRVVFLMVVVVGIFFLFEWVVNNQTTDQLVWLASALTESQSDPESQGYFYTLLNEFIFFPDNALSILFGTGMSPMQLIDKNTDVGYIQYIWYYGIVGSVLLYLIYYKLLRYSVKLNTWPDNKLFQAILIMIAIYLVKLTCLGYSMASVIFFPICVFTICNRDNFFNKQWINKNI